MWTVVLSNLAAAECTAPTTFQAYSRVIVEAEQAIRDSDRATLERAERDAETQLQCLRSALRPADVASFMRLKGIAHFVRKERDTSTVWFEAARAVEPSFSLPVSLIPERHPLRRAFESVQVPEEDLTRLPEPAEGTTEVNGRPANEVPARLPWVLQWRNSTGDVAATRIGLGQPQGLPYPLRYPRGRWQVVVAAAAQLSPSSGPGDFRGVGAGRFLYELGGPIAIDAGVRTSITGVPVPDAEFTEVRLTPGVHLGGRAWVTGDLLFFGASALVTSHGQSVIAPGGALNAGVRLGGPLQFRRPGLRSRLQPRCIRTAGGRCGARSVNLTSVAKSENQRCESTMLAVVVEFASVYTFPVTQHSQVSLRGRRQRVECATVDPGGR